MWVVHVGCACLTSMLTTLATVSKKTPGSLANTLRMPAINVAMLAVRLVFSWRECGSNMVRGLQQRARTSGQNLSHKASATTYKDTSPSACVP